jgi:hypothetical protein
MGAVSLEIQGVHPREVIIVTYVKTAIIILLGFYWNMAVPQQSAEMTNEERDAAWTAEDAAREAAQRIPATAVADAGPIDVLGNFAGEAEVIFHGTVQYQSVVYDSSGVPFTHTTFAVTDKLKGSISGELFTLVQEGGIEQGDSNIVTMSSNSRHFSVGEEELLFLGAEAGNGERDVQIRFRIYGGQVYDEDGRGVFVEAINGGKGHILRLSADRNPDVRFSEIHIGPHTLYKHFGGDEVDYPDAVADGVSASPATLPSYTDGADVGTLIAAIKQPAE